jgi:probable phosphoglycerate mutase
MTKKLFILRHGQTDFNKIGVVQGSGIDAPLNETGKKQADSFFKAYADVPFDVVYTSALKRTHQTVQGFIEAGIPHRIRKELNEIHWGDREGKAFTPEANKYYYDILADWAKGNITRSIEGGESPLDVTKRLIKVIPEILNGPEETILICMHGRAMRVLLCLLLNYPLRCMDYFVHDNCGLYKLIHTGSLMRVEFYNDTRHFSLIAEQA